MHLNKSFIDQFSSVEMPGYWPPSLQRTYLMFDIYVMAHSGQTYCACATKPAKLAVRLEL